ncbi:MAG: bifunctional phosphoribosylaminoimidazolecarboxamide formyltransferase/IMP cyclohydrolase [Thermoplasmata archaeon]
MLKISRALLSVSDKTGIIEFAKGLAAMGVEIISTGGTANLLRNAGIPVKEVSSITGFPEILDGRVKTLHPSIFGGVLAENKEEHLGQLKNHGIQRIEMVCVNLYPFERTIRGEHRLEDAVENIDIGGPSLIRAAAKNYRYTAVVTRKEQYLPVLEEMRKNGGLSEHTLEKLAVEAFRTTAVYDATIYSYFQKKFVGEEFPDTFIAVFEKKLGLRYGENPHQKAAFYAEPNVDFPCITNAEKIQGKELSYNNILDLDAAWRIVTEFAEPACAIVKHTNPSSVAKGENAAMAFARCIASDSLSAYGGIVAFNSTVTEECALKMRKYFLDAIIAPDYEEKALQVLAKKRSIVLRTGGCREIEGYEMKKVGGGLLVQQRDNRVLDEHELKCASKRLPTNEEIAAMLFAWKVVKHVAINGIVFAREHETVGIGPGQTSRVMAVKIAAEKAGEKAKGAVMASDGFFPFRDGIDAAAKAGITAVIQPGGSIRDGEVIDAVNEYGMAMVFTGWRVFRH